MKGVGVVMLVVKGGVVVYNVGGEGGSGGSGGNVGGEGGKDSGW